MNDKKNDDDAIHDGLNNMSLQNFPLFLSRYMNFLHCRNSNVVKMTHRLMFMSNCSVLMMMTIIVMMTLMFKYISFLPCFEINVFLVALGLQEEKKKQLNLEKK